MTNRRLLTTLIAVVLAASAVAHAAAPGKNGAILFLGAGGQIYTTLPDGTHLRQLTHFTDSSTADPSWSRDGSACRVRTRLRRRQADGAPRHLRDERRRHGRARHGLQRLERDTDLVPRRPAPALRTDRRALGRAGRRRHPAPRREDHRRLRRPRRLTRRAECDARPQPRQQQRPLHRRPRKRAAEASHPVEPPCEAEGRLVAGRVTCCSRATTRACSRSGRMAPG